MKYPGLLWVACALVGTLAGRATASQVHWTEVGGKPVCIAIGTMSSVVDSAAAFFSEKQDRDPAGILRIYSSGRLELTEHLYGDPTMQSVPVMWYSACRFEPPVEDLHVSESSQRKYEEGCRRIWVIWAPSGNVDEGPNGYIHFQGYPLDCYDGMLSDMEKELSGSE